MGELGERTLRAAAARADFLDSGREGAVGITSVIASSWERSLTAGVSADRLEVEFYEDLDLDSRLVRCALPVIQRLRSEMIDVPVSIALCDSGARVIHRYDCSSAVARVLDRVYFSPGFGFGEGAVGTNGVGTVFESGDAVTVVGPEHFTERLHPFACSGAPIVDPTSGRAEGILDISCLTDSYSPLLQSIVKSAAADIGRNLLVDRDPAQQRLFEAYLRAGGRAHRAVMGVGDKTLMVNEQAQRLFSPQERQEIIEHGEFLLLRRDRGSDLLELRTGRRARIRALRVGRDDERIGMIILLESGDEPSILPGRSDSEPAIAPHSGTDLGGSSPAWVRAWTAVIAALTRRRGVLVLGENGVGRATMLRDAFTRLYPGGRVIVLEAATMPATPKLSEQPTLVILRDLDRLTATSAPAARRLVDELQHSPSVLTAATMRPDGADLRHEPCHAVVSRFTESVTVPPLRLRTSELSLIVGRLLTELAPDRHVRLSPAAYQALHSHPWPENITQLRSALAAALGRRPVGEIQADDLPGFCRTSSRRTVRGIEAVERDAIVDALRAVGGNRVRAAGALGMSRSSLYRKIKRYGIHDA